jgi:hypothetical protein
VSAGTRSNEVGPCASLSVVSRALCLLATNNLKEVTRRVRVELRAISLDLSLKGFALETESPLPLEGAIVIIQVDKQTASKLEFELREVGADVYVNTSAAGPRT